MKKFVKIHKPSDARKPRTVTIDGVESDYTVWRSGLGYVIRHSGNLVCRARTIREVFEKIRNHIKRSDENVIEN